MSGLCKVEMPAFGEMVIWDSSLYAWLEDRGPTLQLILMLDDATSQI